MPSDTATHALSLIAKRAPRLAALPSPHNLRPLQPTILIVLSIATAFAAFLGAVVLDSKNSFPTWANLFFSFAGVAFFIYCIDRIMVLTASETTELRKAQRALTRIHEDSRLLHKDLFDRGSEQEPGKHILILANDLTRLLHLTASLLQSRVGAPCAVTIKLLSTGIPLVQTIRRDPRSAIEREPREGYSPPDNFLYTANTAFEQLMTMPRLKGLYAASNLAASAVLGEYKNTNETWERLYNATVVQAITPWRDPTKIIGFLCVDSWNELRGDKIGPILAAVENEVYNILQLLCLVQASAESTEEGTLIEPEGGFELGWDCSSGVPRELNSEHQQLLQRAIDSLKAAFKLLDDLPGAHERSTGGELSRANIVPSDLEQGVSTEKFNPTKVHPTDERERELLEKLRQGVPSQRFFPPTVDLARAIWGANRFITTGRDEEFDQIVKEVSDQTNSSDVPH